MKRYLLNRTGGWLISTVVALTTAPVFAQTEIPNEYMDPAAKMAKGFLPVEQIGSSLNILPPPPQEGSADFEHDKAIYWEMKKLRDTDRGALAIQDANTSGNWQGRAFSEAMGFDINEKDTPEIYMLCRRLHLDVARSACRIAKDYYDRTRPFVYFGDHTSTPGAEAYLSQNGSYPSGHTALGWGTALVLAEVNPARQEEIIRRGYEFGQSRLIVGAHWQSDVDAGRMVSSAAVARVHDDPEFQKHLKRAKAECRRVAAAKGLDLDAERARHATAKLQQQADVKAYRDAAKTAAKAKQKVKPIAD